MQKISLIILSTTMFITLHSEHFVLASWNILGQAPYEKHAKVETMPWDERKKLIKDQLKELAKYVDIICLQECDLRGFDEKKNTTNWILKTMADLGFTSALPQEPKQREELNQSYLAGLIFYNAKKFTARNPYIINMGNYRETTTTLTFNKGGLPSIKVISLHRPFGDLDNLEKNIMHHKNKEGFTIICGDFNYATKKIAYPNQILDAQSYKDLTTKERFDKNFWKEACKETCDMPTAYSASGYLEKIDYIFYTPQPNKDSKKYFLETTKSYQIPDYDLWNKFIKHSMPADPSEKYTGPSFSDFPSDHAVLIADFEIDSTEKNKKKDGKTIDQLAKAFKTIS